MCTGKMRNLAPACLNGLGAANLSSGISAVSAQCVEHRLKYRSMNTVMNAILLLICSTCAPWTPPAVNDWGCLVRTGGENICSTIYAMSHEGYWNVQISNRTTTTQLWFPAFFFFFLPKPQCFGWKTHNDMQTVLLCQKKPSYSGSMRFMYADPSQKTRTTADCSGPPSPLDSYYAADV